MKTEYNHGNGLGISNIWFDGSTWMWSNRAGEGCDLSFPGAVESAESALLGVEQMLREAAALLTQEMTVSAHVGPCSAEDDTPTLHVELWRGIDLSDLPAQVASLSVASEGFGEHGRTYSLQLF